MVAGTLALIGDAAGAAAALHSVDTMSSAQLALLNDQPLKRAYFAYTEGLVADAANDAFRAQHRYRDALRTFTELGLTRRVLVTSLRLALVNGDEDLIAFVREHARTLPPSSWIRIQLARFTTWNDDELLGKADALAARAPGVASRRQVDRRDRGRARPHDPDHPQRDLQAAPHVRGGHPAGARQRVRPPRSLPSQVIEGAGRPGCVERPMRIAIRTGMLYDGTDAAPRCNVTVVVEDGHIAEIAGSDAPVDADRRYEAAAIVPGLINSHVHLEVNGEPDIQTFYLIRTPTERTLDAALNARLSLEAGVTTVRDLGASGFNAIALRDAIARGEHAGPTIVPAGRALCMTGGHGFFLGRETDGPWDARKAVREQRKGGASCIKLIATGGVLTKGAVPGQDQLSEEEMRAAIVEARTHGMRVAAHAIGTNGIKNALRAGVDSIEHGHLLDDEAIELFKKQGAYLVPTLAAVWRISRTSPAGRSPSTSCARRPRSITKPATTSARPIRRA